MFIPFIFYKIYKRHGPQYLAASCVAFCVRVNYCIENLVEKEIWITSHYVESKTFSQ